MSYIDDLSTEYFTAYLDAAPTEAHVLGQYAWADRFDFSEIDWLEQAIGDIEEAEFG